MIDSYLIRAATIRAIERRGLAAGMPDAMRKGWHAAHNAGVEHAREVATIERDAIESHLVATMPAALQPSAESRVPCVRISPRDSIHFRPVAPFPVMPRNDSDFVGFGHVIPFGRAIVPDALRRAL